MFVPDRRVTVETLQLCNLKLFSWNVWRNDISWRLVHGVCSSPQRVEDTGERKEWGNSPSMLLLVTVVEIKADVASKSF